MKTIILIFLIMPFVVHSQSSIKYLSGVPEKFITQYYQKLHNYNPLQVGNLWVYQQTDTDGSKHYFRRSVVKDTIVNSKKYFKKVDYRSKTIMINNIPTSVNLFDWERNDTLKKASYMLDIEDLNNNGKTDDELLLDSLEVPQNKDPRNLFLSYRYTWKNVPGLSNPAHVGFFSPKDSSWAIIFGDTVMTRQVQYGEKFLEEIIADKYGVVYILNEGPAAILTGAKINGKQYGTIVSVKKMENNLPSDVVLYNNYPNPFNPATTIKFEIPTASFVTIKVFDMLGKEIATLVNETKSAGYYNVTFDASKLTSGVYIYTISTNNFTQSRKILLMK